MMTRLHVLSYLFIWSSPLSVLLLSDLSFFSSLPSQPSAEGFPHVSLVFLVKGSFPLPLFKTLKFHASPRDSHDCNDGDIDEV